MAVCVALLATGHNGRDHIYFIGYLLAFYMVMLGLETSDQLAGFYGSEEIAYRKLASPAELVRRIGKVTAKEVQAVARALFRDATLNLAVIGPYQDETAFRDILRFP